MITIQSINASETLVQLHEVAKAALLPGAVPASKLEAACEAERLAFVNLSSRGAARREAFAKVRALLIEVAS